MSVKPVSFAAEQSVTSAAQPMRPVFARLSLKYARSNMTQSAVVTEKPTVMNVSPTQMAYLRSIKGNAQIFLLLAVRPYTCQYAGPTDIHMKIIAPPILPRLK